MRNAALILTIVIGLGVVGLLSRAIDARRADTQARFAEEPLYVTPVAAKRLSLAFNGLAADWYWMRSLQYVGGKIVTYEDTHDGRIDFGRLTNLDLRLLPSLLRTSTTLDPQFMAPYEYGAMILPEINSDHAINLLNAGIAANPSAWRLYQHLGYVYWKRNDYHKASEAYTAGAKLPGAPPWMMAIGARMKAEGGSRDAAREMYRHLYDSSSDEAVKQMVTKQLMRLDSLDERETIRRVLKEYETRNGRCPSSWREVNEGLRATHLKIDHATGAPLDPSETPYELIKNGCDVDLDINTKVPIR
jgi:tetratricopeptide (TPR) repeat protein